MNSTLPKTKIFSPFVNKVYRNQKGQMLIGILVAITIFLILSHALFTLTAASFSMVSFNRARITARHLAQEKMETIKNMDFFDVGTSGGIPAGNIAQVENIERNGLNFVINTQVIYIDDPFDNVAPTDTNPQDYKRVKVKVSWEGVARSGGNPVALISDLSQFSTGTNDSGSLAILVVDANGNPVSQADVSITAPAADPPVNLSLQTNSEGEIILPGATPCVSCYRIVVTKSGYSTDRTYSTSEVTNPIKPDTSVFEDDVTQVSFAIDRLSNLTIRSFNSRENDFTALGNVPFRIRGNKIIGTNLSAQPVYKYDETVSTDAGGQKNLNNIEWDVYTILMPNVTTYDISGTNPVLPLNLVPAGSLDFNFSVNSHTPHSFFLTVTDPTQQLIASASARLYDGTGFDETKFTGISPNPDEGQVHFGNLTEQSYQLVATASGYLNFNGNFDVSGNTTGVVVLTPQ